MRSQFYQDIIIEKSWQFLKKLKKQFPFILLGGWAVYLYTHALKSKDIDLIVDYQTLEKLKKDYEVYKNERLKKYEIKKEGIDVDIYLPYFSHLGLAVDKIIPYTEKRETFTVVKKELLLITKLAAYLSRKGTVKGEKDKIDIIALLFSPDFDFNFYKNFLLSNKLSAYSHLLNEVLDETKEIKELGLNRHIFAKKKKEVLKIFTGH